MTKTTQNTSSCWNCDGDISQVTQRLEEMFVEMGQKTRIENGQQPAERAVFRKQHGIAYGQFLINSDIDDNFKVGIFAGDSYDCAIRFSSDTLPTAPDLHSTLGLGLKLFGVEGPKLFGEGTNADFIFQNIDRFFARDAQQMCSFTTAGVVDRDYDSYIDKHPKLGSILKAMQKEEASVLSASYWAILPFKLGEHQIVKYRLVPEDTYQGTPFDNANYLALDLQQRLLNNKNGATFRFEIQLRTNEETMPLDNAQVVWSTEESPYICIAKLHLPQQDVCSIGQANFGSNLAFNIWRTLPEHEPLGSIAEARKVVYAASAETRHQANGQSMEEPKEINPRFRGNIDENSDCIVKAGIYPPIGVMRVGNSKDEYFIGPLVDTPIPQSDPYAYRDKTGALKRQAAQFRIYGFNAAGKAVKELTAENATIKWHAHLANQKSSWYQFNIALDIPEAKDYPPAMLRNIDVKNRKDLLIDGKAKSIKGEKDKKPKKFVGKFMGEKVYLGEMRTDEKGRLLMLGGHGKSKNIHGDVAITFANNEGWHDDISDGPVTAEVIYNGTRLKVDPAWVICAPPDYAPMQKSVRTMWDLMRSVAVKSGMLHRPVRPSFTKDILPIFQRMTDLQWVNAGFAGAFGFGGQFNYTTKEWIKKLGNPSPAYLEMRRTISNNFRRINVPGAEAPQLWPWLYGDAIDLSNPNSVRQHATLSDLQLEFLDQWVQGDFDADYIETTGCPYSAKTPEIDDLDIAEQPDMLTKAAMDFCLADAFHPGCEMTWPMRSSGMYMAPFRVKHAPKTPPANTEYYGPIMNNDVLPLARGPILGGQVAGGITRWMAIPWQTDTASCRDGYTSSYDPYLPTFWPARVPNNVLNEERYQQAMNHELDEETRIQAFNYRADWLDDLPLKGAPATYTNQINSMIAHFDKLAVVQQRPGVIHDPNFPHTMQVGMTPTSAQKIEALKEKLHNVTHLRDEHLEALKVALQKMSDTSLLKSTNTVQDSKQELAHFKSQLLDHVKNEFAPKDLAKEEVLSNSFDDINSIEEAIDIAISELQNSNQSNSHQEKANNKTEIGIPEKMSRFSRYSPK